MTGRSSFLHPRVSLLPWQLKHATEVYVPELQSIAEWAGKSVRLVSQDERGEFDPGNKLKRSEKLAKTRESQT